MDLQPLPQYSAYPIPVDRIYYDADFNCRGEFTLQSVSDLADSIVKAGRLIYPVTVQPWTDERGYDYRLIAGFRRFKAMTVFLKAKEVPAVVVSDLTDHQAQLLNVVENLQRKDLNIWEEALRPGTAVPGRRYASPGRPRTKADDALGPRPATTPEDAARGSAEGRSRPALGRKSGHVGRHRQAGRPAVGGRQDCGGRQRGRGNRLPGLERAYKQSKVRTREEINKMVERMLLAGIGGLAPRVGALGAQGTSRTKCY